MPPVPPDPRNSDRDLLLPDAQVPTDQDVQATEPPVQSSSKVSQRRSRYGWWIGVAIAAAVTTIVFSQIPPVTLLRPLENLVFYLEDHYQAQVMKQASAHPITLMAIAFGGGLIASLSPCILALLPINLSYIGTRTVTSRWAALRNAIAFVLGVVTIASLFGLFSSLAGLVTIQYQGVVYIVVGTLIGLMGLSLLEIIRLRLPQTSIQLPIPGAYGVGVTFALVSSPCTSPVMFSVLAAAATTGSQVQGILTMISYALGYTAVIFLASICTGLVTQTRWLLQHSETLLRLGGAILLMASAYYLVSGIRWVWVIWFAA